MPERRLAGSDFYTLYSPSRCRRRVWLAARADEAWEPGEFEQLLIRLGREHESGHLEALRAAGRTVLSFAGQPLEARRRGTAAALLDEADVLHHPRLEATRSLGGADVLCVGEPDFLLREDGGWVVRDTKLARRIEEPDHPEIFLQLRYYGWLLEAVTGEAPRRLEVLSSGGEVHRVPQCPEAELREALAELLELREAEEEPDDPVGWSKCARCAFRPHCFEPAWRARDAALVPGVDQGLARSLRADGIRSAAQLIAVHDEDSLAERVRPWGSREQRVGDSRASSILRCARAIAEDRELRFADPGLPEGESFVMFDVEAVPPHVGGTEGVFLWGLQVFGADPGPFRFALAGFDQAGDERGWFDFLEQCEAILEEYGDLAFVHWSPYERTQMNRYLERHGDRGHVARRVLGLLFDALDAARRSVALPLPSYSLKVLEGHVGFRRSQEGVGGDWAIARWLEAADCPDPARRAALIEEVLTYNREDLEATWAVFSWLRQA